MAETDTGERIAHVAEISRNARATWFGLIGALLFAGVTLLDVQDRDFFEYGAATRLPLVGVDVPVVGFFVTAPLLILALYAYLHIYLMKLWRGLAELPDRIGGNHLEDVVFPWMLSDAALRLKTGNRRDFGWLTGAISWALAWGFAPTVLAAFWIRSFPYHDERLTLWIGALLSFSFWVGHRSDRRVEDWMRRGGAEEPDIDRGIGNLSVAVLLLVTVIGWERTEGPTLALAPFNNEAGTRFLASADLYRADIAQRSPDWLGRDRAWDSFRRINREHIESELEREIPATPPGEEEIVARLRREFDAARKEDAAYLEKYDWPQVDLRQANLREAFLVGLDLSGARMEGANLRSARMEGANLRRAQMEGAVLRLARMEGANLRGAQMAGANLGYARMEGANLLGIA